MARRWSGGRHDRGITGAGTFRGLGRRGLLMCLGNIDQSVVGGEEGELHAS
jgi:hypothetical protein